MPDVWAQEPCPNPYLWPVWEHPKDEHEKTAALCAKTWKNAVASPLKVIFSLEMGLPEKNHNNFSFWFLLPHSVRITILFSQ